jgi:hypothetical protein
LDVGGEIHAVATSCHILAGLDDGDNDYHDGYETVGGMRIGKGNFSAPLCSPQIPQ